MGKGRDFLLSSVFFYISHGCDRKGVEGKRPSFGLWLEYSPLWQGKHVEFVVAGACSWDFLHLGKPGIRAQGIVAFLSLFAFNPEPQPMWWCQPKSGWAFLPQWRSLEKPPRHPQECVSQVIPNPGSWQWRLVITPGVRSHPSPVNKQTNKESMVS